MTKPKWNTSYSWPQSCTPNEEIQTFKRIHRIVQQYGVRTIAQCEELLTSNVDYFSVNIFIPLSYDVLSIIFVI